MDGSTQPETNVVPGRSGEGRINLRDNSTFFAFVIDDQMDEDLGAEILDDANATSNRTVADDDCLGTEADRRALAAKIVSDADLRATDLQWTGWRRGQEVHRR